MPLWLLMHFQVRANLRKLFGMPEYNFEDAVVMCFCEGCAMCQEMNEVDLRIAAGQDPKTMVAAPVQMVMAPVVYANPVQGTPVIMAPPVAPVVAKQV